MRKKISVLGAGAWGTAVANMIANNGHTVTLWCFEQEVVSDIIENRLNKTYLPGVQLDENITPTVSLHDAVGNTDIVFEAIPVPFLSDALEPIQSLVQKDQIWVVLSKGIENETGRFASEILQNAFSITPHIAVLSGPNFADQVAAKRLTAAKVASTEMSIAEKIEKICANDYFKIFKTSDIYGVQVGGALKNVMTIFLGILQGFGCVENTRSYFLTCCLKEMTDIAKHFEGDHKTIYGISGLGDLVLGIIGKRNRNYSVGEMFGKGMLLKDLLETSDVLPEGINTTKSMYQIIKKHNVHFPICLGTHQIIFENKPIKEVLHAMWETVKP